MSALHQAVARAIADAMYGDPVRRRVERIALRDERAAAAAVGVCLAEAQRQVEALRAEHQSRSVCSTCARAALDEALAALAALAEEQA